MSFQKDFAENSDLMFYQALGEASVAIEKAAAINVMRLCSEEDRARIELMATGGLTSAEHSDEIQERMTGVMQNAVEKMSAVLVDSYGVTSVKPED